MSILIDLNLENLHNSMSQRKGQAVSETSSYAAAGEDCITNHFSA